MDLQRGLEKKADKIDHENTHKVKADKTETEELKARIDKLEEFAK